MTFAFTPGQPLSYQLGQGFGIPATQAPSYGVLAPPNATNGFNTYLGSMGLTQADIAGLPMEQRVNLGMGYNTFQQTADTNQANMAMARDWLAQSKPSVFQQGAQTFGTIAQGIGSLYGIYAGLQGMKEQKRNNAFQRGVVNTNLNNSITDYNRRLTDTLTNRSLNNGQGQGYVSSQLEKYQAKRYG